MKTKSLIVLTCIVIVVLVLAQISNISDPPATGETDGVAPVTDTSLPEQLVDSEPAGSLVNGPEVTQSQIEEMLKHIANRSDEVQTESTIGELDDLVERYDEMSHAEKRDLLTSFATLFLRNSQYADARYLYEQILQLPDLDYTNRLAILQMLARISIASEDWEGFLVYNDQYFDEGGGYNWVVTGNLIRAFQQLENFDAAGEAVLLHIETGIHPEYDGSDAQYQRLYERIDSIPLDMSDRSNAVLVAEKMAELFDRPQNWRILSQLHTANNDTTNFNQVIESARAKGFVDSAGNWIDEKATQ
ncbi:MAG: hypothetical protein Q8S94_07560 [Pseudohongiella sp.]|nr:hypothetical protein [Pseudohongiella sp.]